MATATIDTISASNHGRVAQDRGLARLIDDIHRRRDAAEAERKAAADRDRERVRREELFEVLFGLD